MSYDDFLRRQTEQQYINNPNTPKVESHQVPDHHTQSVINAEIERQRQADEERRRQQQG